MRQSLDRLHCARRRIDGQVERARDPPARCLVLTVDALRVDLEQDVNAMPGPLGYLGGRNALVEPERHGRVPRAARRTVAGKRPTLLRLGRIVPPVY